MLFCLCESLDRLEPIPRIVVSRDNQDWCNLTKFYEVFIAEVLRIGAGAWEIEKVTCDDYDVGFSLLGDGDDLVQYLSLLAVQVVSRLEFDLCANLLCVRFAFRALEGGLVLGESINPPSL